jgi:hypothetical protein
MIRLLFVGDGERDAATNPHLVSTIIGAPVAPATTGWPRLSRAGSGYDRKLLFAIRTARHDGLDGVVATVDRDKSRRWDRLRDLETARRMDRETAAPLPTALGCAVPHAEAWLLDDALAVRRSLMLAAEAVIPNVSKVASPKSELSGLHSASPRAEEPIRSILVDIAQRLDPSHCQHADQTGFARFADGVRREIGPLAARS